MFAFLQNIGITELLVILLIVLILFGTSRIPTLARSLGRSVKEFKKGLQEGEEPEKKSDSQLPKE
jgi:sec-independent protein translocase protein TatA